MKPAVLAEKLSKQYGTSERPVRALDDVDLTVAAEERVALVGRSGSGKSTLLNLLAGLDRPTSGNLQVADRAIGKLTSQQLADYRCRDIGVVFQSFQLLPHYSAIQNVEIPLMLQRTPKRERHRLALQAIERVGLADRATHRPHELSGGEQQRVAVARAIVHRPGLLLADEPTGNLDSRTAEQVMQLILDVVDETKAAMILITHDRRLAESSAHRTVTLSDGKIEAAS